MEMALKREGCWRRMGNAFVHIVSVLPINACVSFFLRLFHCRDSLFFDSVISARRTGASGIRDMHDISHHRMEYYSCGIVCNIYSEITPSPASGFTARRTHMSH